MILLNGASNPIEPNILISTILEVPDSDQSILKPYNESISEELRSSEFNVIVIEKITLEDELINIARSMNAFYILRTEISVKKSKIIMDISCYSIQEERTLVSYSQIIKDNQTLEHEIQKYLEDIILIIKKNMNSDIQNSQNNEPINNESAESEVQTQRFWFEIKAAPFQALGDVTKYFTLGFNASLFAGYRTFFFNSSDLSFGLEASFNRFLAEGVLTSSENYLISLGPDIRWSIDLNHFLSMFFHLSSGVSLFTVNVNDEGPISTVIPYLTSGLGIDFSISYNFGLSLILDYSIFFERSTLISGFIPGGGISWSF